MAELTTRQRLRTLNLSARQLKDMTRGSGAEWPDSLVNDYLTIFGNLTNVSISTDDNIERIDENEANININATNFSNHDISTTEHGVIGNNVGDENFCTELVGGVVLLMELVSDAVSSSEEITLSNIASAPASYNQAYIQTLADMANDTKLKHNNMLLDLNNAIDQLNDLISKAKTSKQMSA